MSINWFTVIAQIVNFLILVWLLKRLLYKPVLKAIADREKLIEGQIASAQQMAAKAKKEQEEFMAKNEAFDRDKKAMIDKARSEVQDEKEQGIISARKEAESLRKKLETAVKKEGDELGKEIAGKTNNELFSITGKILRELADSSLEEQITRVFILRLNELEETQKKEVKTAFGMSTNPVQIFSAFKLKASQTTRIEKAVKSLLDNSVKFQFKVDSQLVAGIELNANGYKIAWNISDYLAALEEQVKAVMEAKSLYSISEEKEHNGQ